MGRLTTTLASIVFFAAGIAVADNCDPAAVAEKTSQLQWASHQFDDLVRGQAGFTSLSRDAYQLERAAEQFGASAPKTTSCARLNRDFTTNVSPVYEALRHNHHWLQNQHPNETVRAGYRQLRGTYEAVSSTLVFLSPATDACQGLAGAYQGTCRIVNGTGTSVIGFLVGARDQQCVAYNSPLFQPVVLGIANGQGSAALTQAPGGPAFEKTTLSVTGAGRFMVTGYNYAGHFYFRCEP